MSAHSGPNLKLAVRANMNGLIDDQLQLHYDSAR